MKILFLLSLLLTRQAFSQDYSLTPTGQVFTTVQAAKSFTPKKERKPGQVVYVKEIERLYFWTANGDLIPGTGFLQVEDFRDTGETDAQVWQQAVEYNIKQGGVLHSGNHTYHFDTPVFITGRVQIIAEGTVIVNSSPYKPIDQVVRPDLSYPNAMNPGPMWGCAFYCTGLAYECRFVGIDFYSFRFGIAFFQPYNSPVFERCRFYDGNVGIFCYQGSQNYQLISCSAIKLGCLYASSATAFPAGSPYAGGDNYFTDGLTVKNQGGSFNCVVQPAFDEWFRLSIFRPAVRSFAAGNVQVKDNAGISYDCSSGACDISGRAIYVPMRQYRIIFGPQFADLDVRGEMPRGVVLLNSTVNDMVMSGRMQFEGVFKDNSSWAFFTIGSALSGSILAPFNSLDNPTHNLIDFTGRGFGGSYERFTWANGWTTGSAKVDAIIRANKHYCVGIIGEAYDKGILDFQIRDNHTVQDVTAMLGNATLYIENGPDDIPVSKVHAEGRKGQEATVLRFQLPAGTYAGLSGKRAIIVFATYRPSGQ